MTTPEGRVKNAIWRKMIVRRKAMKALRAKQLSIAQNKSIIKRVRQGEMSMRYAATLLDCTVDDISEAAFGEVVL